MSAIDLVLSILAFAPLLGCAYLLVLTLLSGRRAPPAAPAPARRFDVIVPAHDEEAGIGGTVESLLAMDYPRDLFRVLVVADNCSDATAERAAAAGAQVLVRDDENLRGKGYALKLAFEESLRGKADAVVVVDADTLVSRNLLTAFDARLAEGAKAAQAEYAVRNPDDSWRTRLIAIAFALFHDVRSRGRERLRLSCGLRGNGMCFSRQVLAEVPYEAFSLVEDVEYGLRLGESGARIHYAGEARVFGVMVSGEKAARSQRRRWEGGRFALARVQGPRLLKLAFARGDATLLDLALDLLLPPLSILAAWVAALLVLALLVHAQTATLLSLGAAICLVAYVARGWMLSGTGLRGLLALAAAPFFVLWKVALLLRPRRSREWVRTNREDATP
jgi:cellulose synthase/poly-beta-1,6-N-acetylglucosamine synthase-like glycosyltransferase